MNLELESAALRLAKGQVLRVRDGAGSTVCAREGVLWVTEENSASDVLLAAGQCFRLRKPGLAVVQAVDDASVSLA
jgi:hypothetical protein